MKTNKICEINIKFFGTKMIVDPKEALDRAIDVLNSQVQEMLLDEEFKKEFKEI